MDPTGWPEGTKLPGCGQYDRVVCAESAAWDSLPSVFITPGASEMTIAKVRMNRQGRKSLFVVTDHPPVFSSVGPGASMDQGIIR